MPLSPMFDDIKIRNRLVRNRLTLAPLTNKQSHADGCISESELHWMALRANGGFGLITSAAGAVAGDGQAFDGQPGFYSDNHLAGLARIAAVIRKGGAVSLAQLQHGGARSRADLTGVSPVGPSAIGGARALGEDELPHIVAQFVAAAMRAERAGFDGVQLHAAYSFLLASFLSPTLNKRIDDFGGSYENRTRLIWSIVAAVRAHIRSDTILSVRLNRGSDDMPQREVDRLVSELLLSGAVDHVDIVVEEGADLSWLATIAKGKGKVGVTGGFSTRATIEPALASGADFIGLGSVAILHPDAPRLLLANPGWSPMHLPACPSYLARQGVTAPFLNYLDSIPGFVAREELAAA